ncbi:hypothetical protein NC796_03305 [Aliifodinibius sp. S!AR15-10]|uniref:hypothetical protein n=1 Tax=Aliifodinibius sp. S!AR15-10 TaxID=2950437 RepID=UPI0028662822|nr:hypothetical protein [Aliifodinibius sp. S!AR15-10]MDR8390153.1 hypothetical protein [Aliifodinibius sp. S!AR15-10]
MVKHKISTWFHAAVLLVVFWVAHSGLQAQHVTEYVQVDSLTVGDSFSYKITLNKDQVYDRVLFPDSSNFGDAIEIRSRQHFKVTDFKDSLVYRLQYFGTEDTQIPALPVALLAGNDTTTVYTNPVSISFKSVLQSEEEAFRPLKPIFDFARAWWPYIAGLIVLALFGWYLYRLYQQKSLEPKPEPRPEFQPTPFVDPLAQLENSLKQLRSFTFEEEEDFKQFYINLGDAIRTYFEDLYKIPALESTSREIIQALERRMADERMINQTRKVLQQADMVKFAKFQPTEEQAEVSLSVAEEFVKVARNNDGPRIEQMRRQHQSRMEEQRRAYEEETEPESKELQNA